jgi:hypothetical protein
MAQFKTNPWSLGNLLEMLDRGKVVLPEFQRSFVWRPLDIDLLLTSIVQDFPAGSLLFLRSDASSPLAWRLVEGVDDTGQGRDPDYLVLDGQQRLTSLSLALNGRGDHLFFMDLPRLEQDDIEGGIYPLRRVEAERKGLLDRQRQWELHTYPVWAATGPSADDFWFEDYVEHHAEQGGDREDMRNRARRLRQIYVEPLKNYSFPVVELPPDTSLEAVCQIFETLNKTGMKLTVFDLLTARFWPQGLNLRQMFQDAREDFPLLGDEEFDVDATALLQGIALTRSGVCKRGDLLLLERANFESDWARICAAASTSLSILRTECGVLTRKWLPYGALLPALFAVAATIHEMRGPDVGAAWEKIKRWFWCSCFGQRYEGPINTLNATDYRHLLGWFQDDNNIPEAVSRFTIEDIGPSRIERQRNAIYRGIVCLTVVNGARDFYSGQRLNADALRDPNRQIEDHHLFPSGYLMKPPNGRDPENSIVNRCLIDNQTNRTISDKAPSQYLEAIERKLGADKLEEILDSHLIPQTGPGTIRNNDVDAFLVARERLLMGAIASVTGAVIKDAEPTDTYLDPSRPFTNELALRRVIRGLEGTVFWYEQHMSRNALELLAEEVDLTRVKAIQLLSGPANVNDKARRQLDRFQAEMQAQGIESDWRVLSEDSARDLHARVIFDEAHMWELPPLNSLLKGTVDSIRPSHMPKDSFFRAWEHAQPIR